MPLWQANSCTHIGTIIKSHSYLGHARVAVLFQGLRKIIKPKAFIFILFEEKPVPFLIEEVRWLDADNALIKFVDVNSDADLQPLLGREIVIEEKLLPKSAKQEAEGPKIIGYEVKDETGKLIGTVTDIIEETAQPLLEVETSPENSIFIPFHKDLVLKVSHKNKLLTVALPEGFLEI